MQRIIVVFQNIYDYPKFDFVFTSSLFESYQSSLINYCCLEVPVHVIHSHNLPATLNFYMSVPMSLIIQHEDIHVRFVE